MATITEVKAKAIDQLSNLLDSDVKNDHEDVLLACKSLTELEIDNSTDGGDVDWTEEINDLYSKDDAQEILIGINKSNIENNSERLNTNNVDVAELKTGVSTNANAIDAILNDKNDIEKDIDELKEKVDLNTETNEFQNKKLDKHQGDIDGLEIITTVLENDSSEHRSNIKSLNTKVAVNQADISANRGSINGHTQSIAYNSTRIDTINDIVDDQNSLISNVQDDVVEIKSDVILNQGGIAKNISNIKVLDDTTFEHDDRITYIESILGSGGSGVNVKTDLLSIDNYTTETISNEWRTIAVVNRHITNPQQCTATFRITCALDDNILSSVTLNVTLADMHASAGCGCTGSILGVEHYRIIESSESDYYQLQVYSQNNAYQLYIAMINDRSIDPPDKDTTGHLEGWSKWTEPEPSLPKVEPILDIVIAASQSGIQYFGNISVNGRSEYNDDVLVNGAVTADSGNYGSLMVSGSDVRHHGELIDKDDVGLSEIENYPLIDSKDSETYGYASTDALDEASKKIEHDYRSSTNSNLQGYVKTNEDEWTGIAETEIPHGIELTILDKKEDMYCSISAKISLKDNYPSISIEGIHGDYRILNGIRLFKDVYDTFQIQVRTDSYSEALYIISIPVPDTITDLHNATHRNYSWKISDETYTAGTTVGIMADISDRYPGNTIYGNTHHKGELLLNDVNIGERLDDIGEGFEPFNLSLTGDITGSVKIDGKEDGEIDCKLNSLDRLVLKSPNNQHIAVVTIDNDGAVVLTSGEHVFELISADGNMVAYKDIHLKGEVS